MLTSNFHNAYSAKQNDVLFFIFPIVLHPSKVLHQTASSIYDDVRNFKKKSEFLGEIGNNLLLKERMDMLDIPRVSRQVARLASEVS